MAPSIVTLRVSKTAKLPKMKSPTPCASPTCGATFLEKCCRTLLGTAPCRNFIMFTLENHCFRFSTEPKTGYLCVVGPAEICHRRQISLRNEKYVARKVDFPFEGKINPGDAEWFPLDLRRKCKTLGTPVCRKLGMHAYLKLGSRTNLLRIYAVNGKLPLVASWMTSPNEV